MQHNASQVPPHQATDTQVKGPRRLPTGHRTVYAHVPVPTFNHAKAQAYLSGLPWPKYVAWLLSEAKPYVAKGLPETQPLAPELASAAAGGKP